MTTLEFDHLQKKLATRWLARHYRWLEETDSTNRVALEWAAAGAPHGATVVAEAQNAGRGRLGRQFFSPPGSNLYSSTILDLPDGAALAPTLVFAAAIAVAQCVEEEVDKEAIEIKWPNDVLIRGRKTSGILLESASAPTEGLAGRIVLGIGVNLNVDPSTFPDEFRERATSVAAERGGPVDRAGFAARLYGTLEALVERHERGGFEALRADFMARFRMVGRRVTVGDATGGSKRGQPAPGAEVARGHVLGIDADGALRLSRNDGSQERVLAGDVTLVKEATR